MGVSLLREVLAGFEHPPRYAAPSNPITQSHAWLPAAIACTLIETAKLNAVDPHAWLADTLASIADHKITKVDGFFPWSHAR